MLFTNARLATLSGGEPYGLIPDGAFCVENGTITWVGVTASLSHSQRDQNQIDLEGRMVTPGLIDCHTHVVHMGNRANEFEMRLAGKSYEEIAKTGGGIVSTMNATRAASVKELVATALPRVDALIAEGVTTLEIKSGYGLEIETELNMLRAARAIESHRKIRIKTSFLAAHAVPPQFIGRADDYIDEVCLPALEAAHDEKLVDAVDGFCERIAFSSQQIERVFSAAKKLGLPVKLHAEQLSHCGGMQLAARFGALSVDHIEHATKEDVIAISQSGSIAVLLPGAFYTLQESKHPPVKWLRKHGVQMAIATDCNPGSSPLTSLLLVMNMACTLFQLTPEEALKGVTRNAAAALGLSDCGEIRIGMRADLVVWNVDHPAELSYRIGFNPIHQRIFSGQFEDESS